MAKKVMSVYVRYAHSAIQTFLAVFLGSMALSFEQGLEFTWSALASALMAACVAGLRALIKLAYEKFITKNI